jgi:hypothetical protein
MFIIRRYRRPFETKMTEIEMSNEERWFDFHYQYIETGWFDYDRHETIEAMRKLSERLPEEVLDRLPPLVVFAPSAAKLGEVKPFGLGDRLFEDGGATQKELKQMRKLKMDALER